MQLPNNNIAGMAHMIKVDINSLNYLNVLDKTIFFFSDTAVNFTETTTSTSTDPSSGSIKAILPYVDFSEFNSNVDKARAQGKLPSNINFFYE